MIAMGKKAKSKSQGQESRVKKRRPGRPRTKPIDPPNPRGRPSDYRPEYAKQAAKLCSQGYTDGEIADFFGISRQTLYRWQHQFPDFCVTLKAAKDIPDDRTERSLYERANGYSQEAVKIFMPAGASEPVCAKYIERFPPDTTAAIFWLKNRRPDQWRDKTINEHMGKDGGPISITDEDRARAIAAIFSELALKNK